MYELPGVSNEYAEIKVQPPLQEQLEGRLAEVRAALPGDAPQPQQQQQGAPGAARTAEQTRQPQQARPRQSGHGESGLSSQPVSVVRLLSAADCGCASCVPKSAALWSPGLTPFCSRRLQTRQQASEAG